MTRSATTPEAAAPETGETVWGSDRIADALAATGVPYLALVPGSSFRGLHDSLVDQHGDGGPQMLLCTHEEHSVALAHGYAKVTGEPLAVALHANVGLMHATMAIYNAWCDRVPMLMVGATGPVDARLRRPWIDWVHTSTDQAALVRPFVKWDDQPASVGAAVDALTRGARTTRTHPSAPVYVCLDVTTQEEPSEPGPVPHRDRSSAVPDPVPAPELVGRTAALLRGARTPVLLVGRGDRTQQGWDRRVALAEALGARVVTDAKLASVFPTTHPLHAAAPAHFLDPRNAELLREADVVLALEWLDLQGTLAAAGAAPDTVVEATMDHHLHRGWTKDDGGASPADVILACTADAAVAALLDALPGGPEPARLPEPAPDRSEPVGGPIDVPMLQTALWDATRGTDPCLIRTSLSWDAARWPQSGPLDVLGNDGGGGIGSGPGMAVGAALALRGTGRLPVAVLGDGDTLMGGTALWTAAKHDIPLLVVVANNASFYNDEVHQRAVAGRRGRPLENATVGVALDGPTTDLARFAESLGLTGVGPVTDGAALPEVLRDAVAAVRAGGQVLVDVRVARGYAPAMSSALDDGD